ncbi:MAG: YhbY family RNA-binding protein [Candidatus Methylopumilus sp.]|nr:YhbY family RNA-binding protein [Candidatus Methylopumilus sp.]
MNSKAIAYLRSLAHTLNPVVRIGNKGLTESVLKEIDLNLQAHELIKIKVQNDDKSVRGSMLTQICETLEATAVHHIGYQIIIYRALHQPKIILSK